MLINIYVDKNFKNFTKTFNENNLLIIDYFII